MKTIDLRPDYYKHWEAASKGYVFITGVGKVSNELPENEQKFLDDILDIKKFTDHEFSSDPWFKKGKSVELMNIGTAIYCKGGFKLMQKIAIYAMDRLPKKNALLLPLVWDGIGEWEA